MHRALSTLHVLFNSACKCTVCKWMRSNNGFRFGELVDSTNSPNLNPLDISLLGCNAQKHFWKYHPNKKLHGRRYGTVSAGKMNKTVLTSLPEQEAQLMLTNPRNAFRGQSRSPNIVPFHVRYFSSCAIVTVFKTCCSSDIRLHKML